MSERPRCDACKLPVTDTYTQSSVAGSHTVTLCDVCQRLIALNLIPDPRPNAYVQVWT